ncbi:MAG: hypothetical protein U0893_20115 [Chloroflexota bacterium]
MGAIVVGLRPGDHEELKRLAAHAGRPAKELAGIFLEEAIRRESRIVIRREKIDAETDTAIGRA